MKLSERLQAVISERHLLKHPFYQAWTEGRLDRGILRRYAGQYAAQVEAFPRYVSAVHSRCPDISARKVLLQNLIDEELKGTDHPELWARFAEGLGATREEVRHTVRHPETQSMVTTFFRLADGEWTDGLCALYAYESQVPAVATSKMDGLKQFYGIADDRTLSFFKVHTVYDVEHSAQVAALIDAHAEPVAALKATEAASRALWEFLDGMCRAEGISCAKH